MVRHLRSAALLWAALPALALAQAAPAARKDAGRPAAGEQGELKVRTLEERVSDLKEKIFRSKARLMNLQEMVIGGEASSGSKAVLVHRNEMGSSFYLESVSYALDGASVFTKADQDGDLDRKPELEIFSGRVVPGSHQVSVQLVYRGRGYGLFGYLDGYRFKVQSTYAFNAEAGKVSTIKVIGFEKGGLMAQLKDRPAVRYDVDVQREEAPRTGLVPAAAEGAGR